MLVQKKHMDLKCMLGHKHTFVLQEICARSPAAHKHTIVLTNKCAKSIIYVLGPAVASTTFVLDNRCARRCEDSTAHIGAAGNMC